MARNKAWRSATRPLAWGLLGVAAAITGCGSSNDSGLGGDAGLTGGTTSGGSGGSGAGANGGTGGSGPVSCDSDKDCTPLGMLCNKTLGECVSCLSDLDCGETAECLAGSCHPITTCANSLDCPTGEVCDPARLRCYQCIEQADCGPGKICLENTCRSDGSGGSGGAGGAGNGGSSSGGNAGSGANGGTSGNGGSSGSGGSGGGGSCGDLYLLMDRSGSMVDQSKWQDATGAVASFVQQPATAKLRMGMGFFPVEPAVDPMLPATCMNDADCGAYGPCMPIFNQCNGSLSSPIDSCELSDYARPAVGLSTFPGASTQIQSQLTSVMPDGGSTPMTPALAGALQYAKGAAQSGRRAAVVLLTDGEPTGCTFNTVQSVAGVADTAFKGSPSVRTYVVALGNIAELNQVAQAGGTNTAHLITPGTAQAGLVSALQQIRSAEGCQ